MKVLILTCKFGMGHYSAAKSIEQKLRAHYPEVKVGSLDLQDYYQPSPKKLIKDFWREIKNLKIILDDEDHDGLIPSDKSGWTKEIEEVKIVDLFELAYPEYIAMIYKIYGSIVDKGAKLANLIYKKSDEVPPSESKALERVYNHVLGSATKLLHKEKPDLIISAFSVCSEVISDYKKLSQNDLPLITVITDIYPHATWINEKTDHYLVAVEETKEALICNGVEPERIVVVGMPLSPKFEMLRDKSFVEEKAERFAQESVLEKLQDQEAERDKSGENGNDDADKGAGALSSESGETASENEDRATSSKVSGNGKLSPVIFKKSGDLSSSDQNRKRKLLIMGGGLGLVPTSIPFYEALDSRLGMETTVITAKNRNLYKKLHGRFENVHVLGFVDDIKERMLDSDLLLSKSGGITTFESIYAELPMVIFKPFLQQEISNAEFVKTKELGIVLSSKMSKIDRDVDEIVELLFDEERLQKMKENMREIVRQIDEDGVLRVIEKVRAELAQEHGGVSEKEVPIDIQKNRSRSWMGRKDSDRSSVGKKE
ncbi:MAG: glycosyltransferase [Peptostreptococcaceae bacterium]|nr:glycosyltransferase [Peptostreptococcaceae bacterium]